MKITKVPDLESLSTALTAALGRPVNALVSGDELLVRDASDEPLEIDQAVLRRVLDAHVDPVRKDSIDTLIESLNGATTVAKLRDALTEYATAEKQSRQPKTRQSKIREK